MTRVYLIHGWQGSPAAAWRPHLKQTLEEKGMEVFAPQMPNADYPRCHEWVNALAELVGTADENCYFVGHSLGVIAVLRYLQSLAPENKVGGAVLVAGFTSNLGYDVLDDFVCNPINWDKLSKQANHYVAIHSDDDYMVSTHYGHDFFHKKLGAEYVQLSGFKHFAEEDGVTELPIVLEKLESMMASTAALHL